MTNEVIVVTTIKAAGMAVNQYRFDFCASHAVTAMSVSAARS